MNMKSILTPEEKKYLRFFCKYLLSYGEDTATFRFEDFYEGYHEGIGKQGRLYIEENYYLEVPERLIPILTKLSDIAGSNIPSFDEDANNVWAEVKFDAKENTVDIDYCWSYYENDDSSEEFNASEDEQLGEIFDTLQEEGHDSVEVRFNGSGDSGDVEDPTDENGQHLDTDANLQDWCYDALERSYGGWEINEGSQGDFQFNVPERKVILSFAWNNEVTDEKELLSINFSD